MKLLHKNFLRIESVHLCYSAVTGNASAYKPIKGIKKRENTAFGEENHGRARHEPLVRELPELLLGTVYACNYSGILSVFW